VLRVPFGEGIFDALDAGFVKLMSYVMASSSFIFGNLINAGNSSIGYVFALQVLPTTVFFAALIARCIASASCRRSCRAWPR
jgi:CNT family concentrative nucleoside transporter